MECMTNPWDLFHIWGSAHRKHLEREDNFKKKTWKVTGRAFFFFFWLTPRWPIRFLHYPCSQLVTAQGVLLARGAALDVCHNPVVSHRASQCLTKVCPEPVSGRAVVLEAHSLSVIQTSFTCYIWKTEVVWKKGSEKPVTCPKLSARSESIPTGSSKMLVSFIRNHLEAFCDQIIDSL